MKNAINNENIGANGVFVAQRHHNVSSPKALDIYVLAHSTNSLLAILKKQSVKKPVLIFFSSFHFLRHCF